MNKTFQFKIPFYAALVTLITGILISIGIGLFLNWIELREDSIRFEAQVNQVQSRIKARIERFENFLIQARGFFQSKESISREEFKKYALDIQLKDRYAAVQGLAFITRVPAHEFQRHIQQVRLTGIENYKIWPVQDKNEFYPITYIEPSDWRNNRALGYDMFSEITRQSTMEKARDTGLPMLSGKVTLVQEAGQQVQPGFLMFLPIYQRGAATETTEQRRSAHIGFLSTPFRAHDFFKIIFNEQNPLVDFEVYDGTEPSAKSLIYDYDGKLHSEHREVRQIELAGHVYTIAFNSLARQPGHSLLPIFVSLTGIIVSILISWLIRSIGLRVEETRSSQQQLLRRTAELESLQSKLLKAVEQANEANRLKSAFLANMSHEIRTPLGAMIGFADLLRDPGLTQTEKSNYVDILMRNGENLAVIINDILDLSKVEAGHLTLEFTELNPSEIAEEVVSLLQVKSKEKDLTFEYCAEESSPAKIVADPVRLKQILINLAGNAIKFTPAGSVKIRSYGCNTDSGKNAVCFEISDTGIGISPSQIDKVFQMFVQADDSMTRRFGGTGLGLALSKRLAIEMGGDISVVKSEEGVGTVFKVMIEDQPEKKTEVTVIEKSSRETELQSDQTLKGLHVLVVDDAPDNQQLISRYLTKQGAMVESRENGLLGYKAAIAGQFDLVLMDIQMPVMDGYTATQKLRENGYRKPIIALTAHAMSEVRRKALNVGYTDHLTKPINPNELVSTIVRYTRKV